MTQDVYGKVSSRIDADWYPYHLQEWFTQKDICDYFRWDDPDIRKAVSQKLWNDTTRKADPTLEKNNKAYRLIDKDLEELDWMNADIDKVYHLKLPYGMEDQTGFDFEKNIVIPPKGIVVVAGVSNEGKTAFVLNMLLANMDDYPCTYFTNEYTGVGFKRRMKPFEGLFEFTNSDGKPKFRTILRYDHYQDVIDPDGFNIIDYLDVNEQGEYYKLAPYMKQIQKKLKNGIAIIALQKPPNRPDAFGGTNIRSMASLYLSIDKGKLEVVKAKDWIIENPNGKKYAFNIYNQGSLFGGIHGIFEE